MTPQRSDFLQRKALKLKRCQSLRHNIGRKAGLRMARMAEREAAGRWNGIGDKKAIAAAQPGRAGLA